MALLGRPNAPLQSQIDTSKFTLTSYFRDARIQLNAQNLYELAAVYRALADCPAEESLCFPNMHTQKRDAQRKAKSLDPNSSEAMDLQSKIGLMEDRIKKFTSIRTHAGKKGVPSELAPAFEVLQKNADYMLGQSMDPNSKAPDRAEAEGRSRRGGPRRQEGGVGRSGSGDGERGTMSGSAGDEDEPASGGRGRKRKAPAGLAADRPRRAARRPTAATAGSGGGRGGTGQHADGASDSLSR